MQLIVCLKFKQLSPDSEAESSGYDVSLFHIGVVNHIVQVRTAGLIFGWLSVTARISPTRLSCQVFYLNFPGQVPKIHVPL